MEKLSISVNEMPDWVADFRRLYEKALGRFRAGDRAHTAWFSADETAFLRSIGCRTSELFDFAEDHPRISWETALGITSVRREYFLAVQRGHSPANVLAASDFPARDAELGGIRWLPRLIAKAKAKLNGELPDELMYCCGGDRKFFAKHQLTPEDFLRVVWRHWSEETAVLHYVSGTGSRQNRGRNA